MSEYVSKENVPFDSVRDEGCAIIFHIIHNTAYPYHTIPYHMILS